MSTREQKRDQKETGKCSSPERTRSTKSQVAELELIYETAPIGLALLDLELRFVRINKHLAEINGVPAEQHIGRTIREVLPLLAEQAEASCRRVIETGEPALGIKITGTTPADPNTIRTWSVNWSPLKDSAGEVFGINVTVQDITERNRAEEFLRQSEERYRALYEGSSLGIFHSTPEGRIIDVNPALANMLGYDSPQEVVDSIYDIAEQIYVNPPRRDEVYQKLLSEGKTIKVENRYRRKNGEEWDAHLHLRLVQDEGQPAYLEGLIEDITERKHVEAALRESEERFRAVFESSSDCILVWDRQYNYLYANQAAIDHVGTTRDKVIGRNIRDGLGHIPDFMHLWMARVDRAFATGEPFRVEDAVTVGDRLVYSESQVSPIRDDAGRVFGVGVVYRDTTARKQAEEALREIEENFRSLYHGSADAVFMTVPGGPVTGANRAACTMFGMTEEELCKAGRIGIEDPDNPVPQWAIEERVRTGRVRYEATHVRKDGSKFPTEVTSVLLAAGARSIVFIRDITERKQAEDALRESEKKYKSLSSELDLRVRERTAELERKNSELQEFAFIASHDLSEPLRKVQAFGDLLKAKGSDHLSEVEKDYIERMTSAANRMQELLDALLRYSRIGTNGEVPQLTNLYDLAQQVLSDLEIRITDTGVKVEIEDLPTVFGDPSQLRQLFQNLITNAVKYRRPDVLAHVKVSGEEKKGRCYLYVQDNGIGFDEQYLDKIFQPFQRLHGRDKYAGIGMGLAICKKIVERHGGTITAKSIPGKGSTFIITLPLKQKAKRIL